MPLVATPLVLRAVLPDRSLHPSEIVHLAPNVRLEDLDEATAPDPAHLNQHRPDARRPVLWME